MLKLLPESENVEPKKSLAEVFSDEKITHDTLLGARKIGIAVFRLVEYIHQEKPDLIVACDRNARPVGLAVFELYTRLYGRLPTTDGTLRFSKISGNNYDAQNEEIIGSLVKDVLRSSKSERPKVLVLDDWVAGGYTMRKAKDLFERLSENKIQVTFGAMEGDKGDILGILEAPRVSWDNNIALIGVDYADVEGRKVPIVVRSELSRNFRAVMVSSIDALVSSAKR